MSGEKVYEFRIWIETFTQEKKKKKKRTQNKTTTTTKYKKQKTKQKKKGIRMETMLLETMSKHDLDMIG